MLKEMDRRLTHTTFENRILITDPVMEELKFIQISRKLGQTFHCATYHILQIQAVCAQFALIKLSKKENAKC